MKNFHRTGMTLVSLGSAALLCGLSACTLTPQANWYKGNTHTHTLWSDGDGAPEQVALWYASRDYHFLVLSDHNVLSTNDDRWFPVSDAPNSRLTTRRLEALRAQFGEDAVEVRTNGAEKPTVAMRLKTLDELRAQFETHGGFLFIQGEEITDSFERKPVHINAMNIAEYIPPQHGATMRETIQNNLDAVIAHGEAHDRPVLAHINHPNFGWALSVEDVAAIRGERFFEVYNGHPSVRNEGDADHPSMESLWDAALTWRLRETDLGLLYGLATDDAHHYHEMQVGRSNPGRGWVMVRAEELTAVAVIAAMKSGDFYASSGVVLEDLSSDEDTLRFSIAAEDGVTYTTQFIGTRLSGDVGEVLAETTDLNPSYTLRGDELYVRATIVSSRLHPNPYAQGDLESAWVQPIAGGKQ